MNDLEKRRKELAKRISRFAQSGIPPASPSHPPTLQPVAPTIVEQARRVERIARKAVKAATISVPS